MTNDQMKQWAITQVVAKGIATASVAQTVADHMEEPVGFYSLVNAILEAEEAYKEENRQ
jgi:hypothetical protein